MMTFWRVQAKYQINVSANPNPQMANPVAILSCACATPKAATKIDEATTDNVIRV